MIRQLLSDPKVRLAYVATKVGVFVIAALLTWPLSRVVGEKAWIGLGIFGAVLTVMTLVVLSAGSTAASRTGESSQLSHQEKQEEDLNPDLAITIPIEDSLDLHPFPPRDIPSVVNSFLEAAHDKGFLEVRLIHGRGIGVQRTRVQSLLARHPLVSGFHDAPPERGGWGATVVYLRRA